MMTPTNHWEEAALKVLQDESPQTFAALAAEGSLESVVKDATSAALERYAVMMEDGANADAAKEILLADMRDQLLAGRA